MPAFRALLLALVTALAFCGSAWAQEPKGWLGIEVRDLTKAEADQLGWDHGALVAADPAKGSPAEKAGLKAGDLIIGIARSFIDTAADFNAALEHKNAGSELRLQVVSGRRGRRVTVALAIQPGTHTADTAPILQLDTGGNMALIAGVAFTPDGRQIVSAGEDKVVRVWDWQAGKIERTIRGQTGAGDEGKLYAMALSPDGRWLAVGGFMPQGADDIRLYDFAEGRLVALLKGHTNVVNGLAFAPDGRRLISGSADTTAIIWDVEGRQLAQHLKGHGDHVYAVAFTPDGARAVTGSYDRTLKLWLVGNGQEMATLKGHADKVRSVAVSAADGSIASGGYDGEIHLWDGRTGQLLRTVAKQGGAVGALRFSPDGNRLLSTCAGEGCDATQRVWEVATGKQVLAYAKHDNVVGAAALSPDGRLAATGGGDNQEVHIWDLQAGERKRVLVGTGAPGWAAGFSPDGRHIGWGNTWQVTSSKAANPLEWQLRLSTATTPLGLPEKLESAAAAQFLRAYRERGAYALAHRQGGAYGYDAILDVLKDGKVEVSIARGATDGYQHRSYTFAPDGQSIISGGDGGVLTAYDLKGKLLCRFIGHEGDVWAVTPSADGRLLVSGSADQTIRLWNLQTCELIVSLFRGRDGEWVMWTPQGYYTGSPGADKIVGWQINRGPATAADYVTASQLRRQLNRPDIVDKAIALASAEQAVAHSNGISFKVSDLLAQPVPKFRIVASAETANVRGGRTRVKIAIEAVTDPIKAIRIQVNGRQVAEHTPDVGAGGLAGEQSLDVPLAKGRNEVRITLANASGETTQTVTLMCEGDGALDKRGTLYILAIGVDRYPALGNTCGESGEESCDLRYSGADARVLVEAVEKRLGPGHTRVIKRVLVNAVTADDAPTDDDPTSSNILDAIDLLKQAKETDTVLVFIAGHGVNDGPSYRFLATNAARDGDGYRGATVVPWQVLQEAVERAKGRRMLFIDTCHSGGAYSQTLGNAAYHANIIAYTSARFDQNSLEDYTLGHGIFTYAVAEGLDGKGAMAAKREVSTKELADYVIKRVDELAKAMNGVQEPQYFKGRDAEEYVLAP